MVKITRTYYDEKGKELKDIDRFRKLSPSEKIDAIIATTKKKERAGEVARSVGEGVSTIARGVGGIVGRAIKKQAGKSRKRMRYQMKKPASSSLGEHGSDMFRRQNDNKMFGHQTDNGMFRRKKDKKDNRVQKNWDMFSRQNNDNNRKNDISWW